MPAPEHVVVLERGDQLGRRRAAERERLVRGGVLADDAVKKFVDGQKVKKVIYVQDRLVNLVV